MPIGALGLSVLFRALSLKLKLWYVKPKGLTYREFVTQVLDDWKRNENADVAKVLVRSS